MTLTDDIPDPKTSPSQDMINEDEEKPKSRDDVEKVPSDLHCLHNVQFHGQESVSFSKLFFDNWLYVITYCGVFGSFGVCVGFLGPTVFDLGCQTNADLKEMNWVFFVQLIMTLVGSISAGCLVLRVPAHMLMLGGAVGVSLSMFVIPACSNLASLILVLIIMGWCMGCLDCLSNLKMIQMFRNNVGPFLQAMHCLYGVGACVSPLVASMFLLNQDCTPYIDGYNVQTHPHGPTGGNGTKKEKATVSTYVPPQPNRVFRYHHMSRLPTAFFILGGIQLFFAGLVAYVIIQEKMGKLQPKVSSSDHHGSSQSEPSTKCIQGDTITGDCSSGCWACGPRQVVVVTCLTCISLFVFDGLQASFANYIYTYAYESGVKGLHKYEGAYLDACFWGLFAIGRVIAVPVATQLTASFMLVINIAGCALTLLVTIIFRRSRAIIYVGTCGVGLFLSSMSPTVMAMTEQFVDINSSIATYMIVIAALGEALCPVIVGNLVVSSGPGSFLVFCFTLSLCAVFLYVCLTMAGRQTDRFAACRPSSFVWLSRQRNKQDGESTLIKPSSIKYYSNSGDGEPSLEPSCTAARGIAQDLTK